MSRCRACMMGGRKERAKAFYGVARRDLLKYSYSNAFSCVFYLIPFVSHQILCARILL